VFILVVGRSDGQYEYDDEYEDDFPRRS